MKKHIDQYQAEKECKERGQLLPTASELALYAQNRGAQGTSHTDRVGYDFIGGSDLIDGGGLDTFYYSSAGYQGTTVDHAGNNNWFWSSTVLGDFEFDHAFILDGEDGKISPLDRSDDLGEVRCLRSR